MVRVDDAEINKEVEIQSLPSVQFFRPHSLMYFHEFEEFQNMPLAQFALSIILLTS